MEKVSTWELFVCDEQHVHLVIDPNGEHKLDTGLNAGEARHLAMGLLEMANRIDPAN